MEATTSGSFADTSFAKRLTSRVNTVNNFQQQSSSSNTSLITSANQQHQHQQQQQQQQQQPSATQIRRMNKNPNMTNLSASLNNDHPNYMSHLAAKQQQQQQLTTTTLHSTSNQPTHHEIDSPAITTTTTNNNNTNNNTITHGFNQYPLIENDNNNNNNTNNDDDDDSSFDSDSDNEANDTQAAVEARAKRKAKYKVNPFMPSSIKPKMSFERRRWAHLFPLASDGSPMLPNWVKTNTSGPMGHEATISGSVVSSVTSTASEIMSQQMMMQTDNNASMAASSSSNALPMRPTRAGAGVNEPIGFSNDAIVSRTPPVSGRLGQVMNARNALNQSDIVRHQQQLLQEQQQQTQNQWSVNAGGLVNNKSAYIGQSHKAAATAKSNNVNVSKDSWETFNLEESIATTKTGVAWKSLTMPSCLPLTTDYVPRRETWENKFMCSSNYTLLLDVIREQYGYVNYDFGRGKISMEKAFNDLVGHRLAMGFQMVVPKNTFSVGAAAAAAAGGKEPNASGMATGFKSDVSKSGHRSMSKRTQFSSIKGYFKLTLGRIYHELFYLVDSSRSEHVVVEIYIPTRKQRRAKAQPTIQYKYRFQVPDSKTYEISYCDMSRRNVDAINWNLIDSYICIQGKSMFIRSQFFTFYLLLLNE